ncbi:N-acetylmuramoyl-L-alanine amidase [Deinobacterium chartae]|uniref:N-acetylmuramoyl-L-alanine amidase n=1 Tax=Deinobacterium chartae TaxID=521158 RepID=A0A841I4P3_9DEIO|nr:N-acetylmuramoyl-L-alanine amidase [Deinobacterium chartae]MBB6099378.1 N-acetylmuramoyl-L-alanine amidase [Deinobacterium chartae]
MTRPARPILMLDPGHGSTRLAPGYDPGVVYGSRHEAEANLELCLTAKQVLEQADWDVRLTHDGRQGAKPSLRGRIDRAVALGARAFVAVHFNAARSYGLVYHAPGEASLNLARRLAREAGLTRVWPSRASRFRGLYVDAFPDHAPAVLWEVAAIDRAPAPGAAGRAARLRHAHALERALRYLSDR